MWPTSESAKRKPKVLFTLTGGGYLWEAKQLVNQVTSDIEFIYVTTSDSLIPSFTEIPKGDVYRVTNVTTLSEKNYLVRIMKLFKCQWQSLILVRRVKPDMIVCIGSSVSVPLCFAGRLFGIKTVFIESVARVLGLSKTGSIIKKLGLSDNFYVQWPEISSPKDGVHYAGCLL